MSANGGASKNESTSATKVLTAEERGNLMSKFMEQGGGAYNEAIQNSALGPAQTLTGGDYNRLEQNILASRYAPLDRAKALDTQAANQSLADRGIWSSGIAQQTMNDISERYAPQYAAAGGEAVAQRYGLQGQENAAANQYNLAKSQAAWRPADYMLDLYKQTGGSQSEADSMGRGINWGGSY